MVVTTQPMTPTTSTQKVRRVALEGKRAQGRQLQLLRKVRRADPFSVHVEADDPSLTSAAGLVGLARWLRRQEVDAQLRRHFGGIKSGARVVYPMAAQLRLLMDLQFTGRGRVFALESLAADPLFTHLAGGFVPSIDTLYDDLARFDDDALEDLGAMVSEHGLAALRGKKFSTIHVDIDTTVEVVFGEQMEGARPGPNPRYHGRPSYHPILATIAETGTLAGIALRPGDTGFGEDDIPTLRRWLQRIRHEVGPDCVIVVRIDAAGDCAKLLKALQELGVFYVIKAVMNTQLREAATLVTRWHTMDRDADGAPIRQVAEVPFARKVWKQEGVDARVIALREKDRAHGRQLFLWGDLDWTTQAILTNARRHPEERAEDLDEVVRHYNGRAEIEPLIADLKGAWGIGEIPSQQYEANAAMLLLKALCFNLFVRYVAANRPHLVGWRTPWARQVVVLIPGRLVRSGRQWTLRVPPSARWLN